MCLSDVVSSSSPIQPSSSSGDAKRGGVEVMPTEMTGNFRNDFSWILQLPCGILVGYLTTIFALYFPHALTPQAAKAIYLSASYTYDPELSFFDNSAWTFGTDYVLAIVMLQLARRIVKEGSPAATKLKYRAAGLLLLYAVSVTAGGIAHQFYTTLESRNTISFRFLWTICVGTVTAAGGLIGACSSEVARHYGAFCVPDWLWVGFGLYVTGVCVAGQISFQRPACDIFVAGTMQATPSFYFIGVCFYQLLQTARAVKVFESWKCAIAFALNAPLLPGYALLLQIPNVSLAAVNTLLHCWLCITWSTQGHSLLYFTREMKDTKSN